MSTAPALRHADRLLKLSEVMERAGVGKTFIYRYMRAGMFPDSVALTPHCVRWRESDIDRWIESLPSSKTTKHTEQKQDEKQGIQSGISDKGLRRLGIL